MKKWSVVAILGLAQFVMVLDSTVMNVSITQVVDDLNTSVSAMQAAIAFYTLTMAAFMLIGAKLCAKWGLMKAFMIGSIVYGIGSLITAFSSSIGMLFWGWSIIEGLGAVLVIPAIAALVAVNYSGKDRVAAFAIIGGVSGAAAAAGPLIGGYMTTYLSWRYVFAIETIIMIVVIVLGRKFKASKANKNLHIDIPSALLSAVGMVLLVLGFLQSKTWGWVQPINVPVVNGQEIAPFGISLVAYLLLLGVILLKLFYDRQRKLEMTNKEPLLKVSMLSVKQLRSGLGVLFAQYFITASVFFIVPIYLQTVLSFNALETGMKIFPLSIALILFSIAGTKMITKYTPRQIVRFGQVLLVIGTGFLFASIDTDLNSFSFMMAMFIVGAGLGLLASQLGNINMSSVPEKQSNEIGGLQGTFQNIGSSFGTALIGSVLVVSLTNGFISSVNASGIDEGIKTSINQNIKSVEIIPAEQVTSLALENGASQEDAETLEAIYLDSQLESLKNTIFFLFVVSILLISFSRNIPKKI